MRFVPPASLLGLALLAGCSAGKGTVDSPAPTDTGPAAPETCGFTATTDLDPSPTVVGEMVVQ